MLNLNSKPLEWIVGIFTLLIVAKSFIGCNGEKKKYEYEKDVEAGVELHLKACKIYRQTENVDSFLLLSLKSDSFLTEASKKFNRNK